MTHKIIACLRYVCLLFFSRLKVLKSRFWGHFLIKYSTNWRVGRWTHDCLVMKEWPCRESVKKDVKKFGVEREKERYFFLSIVGFINKVYYLCQ